MPARCARKAARMPSSIFECAAMSMAMRVVSMSSALSRAARSLRPCVRPRNHGQFRGVDRGDVEVAKVGLQRGFGQGDGEHPARRHGVEKLPAQTDKADGGFQRHHAGHAGSGVFAHRMADQHGGLGCPSFPKALPGPPRRSGSAAAAWTAGAAPQPRPFPGLRRAARGRGFRPRHRFSAARPRSIHSAKTGSVS